MPPPPAGCVHPHLTRRWPATHPGWHPAAEFVNFGAAPKFTITVVRCQPHNRLPEGCGHPSPYSATGSRTTGYPVPAGAAVPRAGRDLLGLAPGSRCCEVWGDPTIHELGHPVPSHRQAESYAGKAGRRAGTGHWVIRETGFVFSQSLTSRVSWCQPFPGQRGVRCQPRSPHVGRNPGLIALSESIRSSSSRCDSIRPRTTTTGIFGMNRAATFGRPPARSENSGRSTFDSTAKLNRCRPRRATPPPAAQAAGRCSASTRWLAPDQG